jgi:hypothetical protein
VEIKEGHNYVERAMHHNCPICFEYLFDTLREISVLPVAAPSRPDIFVRNPATISPPPEPPDTRMQAVSHPQTPSTASYEFDAEKELHEPKMELQLTVIILKVVDVQKMEPLREFVEHLGGSHTTKESEVSSKPNNE